MSNISLNRLKDVKLKGLFSLLTNDSRISIKTIIQKVNISKLGLYVRNQPKLGTTDIIFTNTCVKNSHNKNVIMLLRRIQ